MKILFCNDGSPEAERALRLGAIITAGCQADAVILGIAEAPGDEHALLQALARGRQLLEGKAASIEVTAKAGDPIREIARRTAETPYDLVVIGAARKGGHGPFAMPAKVYKIIKLIPPPVLTVIGERTRLQHILVCSGGRNYIDKALGVTGQIARCAGAKITLVHVLPEPPEIYGRLLTRGETVDRLLNSTSMLGRNLKREKLALESIGVATEVRLRHGDVVSEVRRELREKSYDLVVAGSAPGRGRLRTYIMGDVTRELLNQADCPVLVVRTGEVFHLPEGLSRFLTELKQVFGRSLLGR